MALATPKSMTLGTGLPSYIVTRTLDGLMSRWMIPFWWENRSRWPVVQPGHLVFL